jgi:hypothetical protein
MLPGSRPWLYQQGIGSFFAPVEIWVYACASKLRTLVFDRSVVTGRHRDWDNLVSVSREDLEMIVAPAFDPRALRPCGFEK